MDIQFRNIISLKTAKLAKEKGFNIFTDVCFANTPNSDDKQYKKIKLHHSHSVGSVDSFGNILTLVAYAPTQSILAKWLREEHNIDVLVTSINGSKLKRYVSKIYVNKLYVKLVGHSDNYENTFEKGLQEALKLINYD